MNCKNIKKNLVSFLENELSEEQRIEIENHFKVCPDCSRLLEEFSQLWGGVQCREKIQPSPYFWTRLKQRIVEFEGRRKPIWGRLERLVRWVRPAVAVAAILVCVFLGYTLGSLPQYANGQTTSQLDECTVALEEFFDSHYSDLLSDLPAGSIEATYLDMIWGE